MWDFRTGANTVLTRKQAEAIGIRLSPLAIGVRLKVEQIEPHVRHFGDSIVFFDDFEYVTPEQVERMWSQGDTADFPFNGKHKSKKGKPD